MLSIWFAVVQLGSAWLCESVQPELHMSANAAQPAYRVPSSTAVGVARYGSTNRSGDGDELLAVDGRFTTTAHDHDAYVELHK